MLLRLQCGLCLRRLARLPFDLLTGLLFGRGRQGSLGGGFLLGLRLVPALLLQSSLLLGSLDRLMASPLRRFFLLRALGCLGPQPLGACCRFGSNPFHLSSFGADLLGACRSVGSYSLDMFGLKLTLGFFLSAHGPLLLGPRRLLLASQLGPLSLTRFDESPLGRLFRSCRGLGPHPLGRFRPSTLSRFRPSTLSRFRPSTLSRFRPSTLSRFRPSTLGFFRPSTFSFFGPSPLGPLIFLGLLPLGSLALESFLFLDPRLLGPGRRCCPNLLDPGGRRCFGRRCGGQCRVGTAGRRRPLPPGTVLALFVLLDRALRSSRGRGPDPFDVAALVGYLSLKSVRRRGSGPTFRTCRRSRRRMLCLSLLLELTSGPSRSCRPDPLNLERVIGRIRNGILNRGTSLRGPLGSLGPDPFHPLGQTVGGRTHPRARVTGRRVAVLIDAGFPLRILVLVRWGGKYPRHDPARVPADRQLRRHPLRVIELEAGRLRFSLIRVPIGCDSHGCS